MDVVESAKHSPNQIESHPDNLNMKVLITTPNLQGLDDCVKLEVNVANLSQDH